MNKRVLVAFSICVLTLCALALRVLSIGMGEYAEVGAYKSSRSLEIAKSRGTIYDCHLEPITNAEFGEALVLKPTQNSLRFVADFVGNEKLLELKESFSEGKPCIVKLPQVVGAHSTGDSRVVKYKKHFSDKQPAIHVIGYLNSEGNGVSGIEKCYNEFLKENSGTLSAAFFTDANGRNLSGANLEIVDKNYDSKVGVALTLDLKIQKTVEEALDFYAVDSGCAVALDPKTGEIKAMASRPTYNPQRVSDSLKENNSPFVNKALSAYSVGSTFKVVVAAASLSEQLDNENIVYTCNGSTKVDNTQINCFDGTSHGTENMEDALAHSCNAYFINLIQQTGATEVVNMAKNMGFGSSYSLADGMASAKGNLPLAENLKSNVDLANLGFGQGTLLATPLQVATAFASIANGGYFTEPYLYLGKVNENGELEQNPKTLNYMARRKNIMSPAVSDTLTRMLKTVVDKNEKGRPDSVTAAGKTATAETGQIKNGKLICHTWFAGWYPANAPKLVIVIMKEDGSTGIKDCAPIFKRIVDNLVVH